MDLLTLQWLAMPTLLVLVGLTVGLLLGSQRSLLRVRRLKRDLNRQHLETLDRSAELLAIDRQDERCERLERLIRLTLVRLKRAEAQAADDRRILDLQQKQHRVEVASMAVQVEQSRERYRAATSLARRATSHLKRLEGELAVVQSLPEPVQQSHRTGEPVRVAVLDQQAAVPAQAPGSAIETMSRSANRDAARLTHRHSSEVERRTATDSLR